MIHREVFEMLLSSKVFHMKLSLKYDIIIPIICYSLQTLVLYRELKRFKGLLYHQRLIQSGRLDSYIENWTSFIKNNRIKKRFYGKFLISLSELKLSGQNKWTDERRPSIETQNNNVVQHSTFGPAIFTDHWGPFNFYG